MNRATLVLFMNDTITLNKQNNLKSIQFKTLQQVSLTIKIILNFGGRGLQPPKPLLVLICDTWLIILNCYLIKFLNWLFVLT